MRRPRVKVEGEGFYHVVSRIGGKRFLIDEKEKAILLGMIRGAAAFSGVELYTFAVMSNHFHLLVRVPRRKEVSDRELERRMLAWYGPGKFAAILEKWEKWTKKGLEMRVADERGRMRARMYDLSQFCKTFKEAYTQDYNKRHENTGTIWEGRFKSILLEGSFRALMTVAGYVHERRWWTRPRIPGGPATAPAARATRSRRTASVDWFRGRVGRRIQPGSRPARPVAMRLQARFRTVSAYRRRRSPVRTRRRIRRTTWWRRTTRAVQSAPVRYGRCCGGSRPASCTAGLWEARRS